MDELVQLQKKQNHIFIMVCINFLLFLILFGGLGYLTYRSTVLVHRLSSDLDRAEQTVAGLQHRIREIDTDAVTDRLIQKTSERLGGALQETVAKADLAAPVFQAVERMSAAQQKMENTAESVRAIGDQVRGLESDELAQRISYHILKGLGDGMQQAADRRKPATETAVEN